MFELERKIVHLGGEPFSRGSKSSFSGCCSVINVMDVVALEVKINVQG